MILPALGILLAGVTVDARFESGSIGTVVFDGAGRVRCEVKGEVDQDGRNRQPSWFYFRLDGVRGRDLVIELTGFHGEYNYRRHDGSGHRHMRPVYSYDNRNWLPFESAEWLPAASGLRVKLKARRKSVWIARQPPYTTRDLNRLLAALRGNRYLQQQIVGRSAEQRPVVLLTITDPGDGLGGKSVIWLMARQHAWEAGTSWVIEGLLRFLLSQEAEAAAIRRTCVFKIFAMADPDGVYRGGVRFNKYGYDLNRNWDVRDPVRMPEIHCQWRAIQDWMESAGRVDLFLTLHNTESADYIEGPLTAGGPAVAELGWRFWRLLVERTSFYSPNGPHDQPSRTETRGRMTVTQALFHELRVPAFLMELMVDSNPKLGRPPMIQDRLRFGRDLATILAAVAPKAAPGRTAGPIKAAGRLAVNSTEVIR